MSDLTSAQFRAAVAAAISGVEHLYREVDLLITRLREELAEEPEPLTLKRGTLGRSGKEDSKRVVVRYEYGALFEPAIDEGEDAEDDDEDDEDGPERLTAGRKAKARRHEIVAGQPLLAVRIAMYDPRKRAAFDPQCSSPFSVIGVSARPRHRLTTASRCSHTCSSEWRGPWPTGSESLKAPGSVRPPPHDEAPAARKAKIGG